MFTCYSEETKEAVSIERDPLPAFDSNPVRKISEETGEKEAFFFRKRIPEAWERMAVTEAPD